MAITVLEYDGEAGQRDPLVYHSHGDLPLHLLPGGQWKTMVFGSWAKALTYLDQQGHQHYYRLDVTLRGIRRTQEE